MKDHSLLMSILLLWFRSWATVVFHLSQFIVHCECHFSFCPSWSHYGFLNMGAWDYVVYVRQMHLFVSFHRRDVNLLLVRSRWDPRLLVRAGSGSGSPAQKPGSEALQLWDIDVTRLIYPLMRVVWNSLVSSEKKTSGENTKVQINSIWWWNLVDHRAYAADLNAQSLVYLQCRK